MENETGAVFKPVHVVLPSDYEEQKARRLGKNYVKIRSKKPKVYTKAEIEEFSKTFPEASWPFDVWFAERQRNQLIQSKGCMIRGGSK